MSYITIYYFLSSRPLTPEGKKHKRRCTVPCAVCNHLTRLITKKNKQQQQQQNKQQH